MSLHSLLCIVYETCNVHAELISLCLLLENPSEEFIASEVNAFVCGMRPLVQRNSFRYLCITACYMPLMHKLYNKAEVI